jgi:geranylgeranyl pyrophosphate synthase
MNKPDFNSIFEDSLKSLLATQYSHNDTLSLACRYALEGQGKRVRPRLVHLCHQIFGNELCHALQAGLAIEFIHTYSLIHDDLPCMDNDNMRRGRPTLHVKFNEAIALLAGDALLTDAFRVLSCDNPREFCPDLKQSGTPLPAPCRLKMIEELSLAAGSSGMVLGQALDLYWTQRQGASKNNLDQIHINKTGRLIAAACTLGALSAGVSEPSTLARFKKFGENIGIAFQIRDDLLDSAGTLGKSTNKDRDQGKLTYLSLLSSQEAQQIATDLTTEAIELMALYRDKASELIHFTQELLDRHH